MKSEKEKENGREKMEVSHIQFPPSKFTTHDSWLAIHCMPLPRTTCRELQGRMTEGPVRKPRSNSVVRKRCVLYPARLERGERGDEPRTISTQTPATIVRDECSDLPVRATAQSHGPVCRSTGRRKAVVRGLQTIAVLPNGPVGGVQSVVGWSYCAADS